MQPVDYAELARKIESQLIDPTGQPLALMCKWLAGVLTNEDRYTVQWIDSGWDCSARCCATGEPFDLKHYLLVGDFLENEPTGNTVATYCSGHGLGAEYYESRAEEVAREILYALVTTDYPEVLDEDACLPDELLDHLCEFALIQAFSKLELADCYLRFKDVCEEEARIREEELRLREVQARNKSVWLQQLAGSIPNEIVAFCGRVKYERCNCSMLIDFLDRLVSEYGATKVCAALTQCRINTSNTVAVDLKARYPEPAYLP